jgi:hypothetical protein
MTKHLMAVLVASAAACGRGSNQATTEWEPVR